MRAVVYDRYGPPDVLHLADVERPAPGPGEVLVKVHATTVNQTDCGFRWARPFVVRVVAGLLHPKRHVLGSELAGVVEALGAGVTRFAVGDHVFGINPGGFGAQAEFVAMRQDAPLAIKPAGTTFEEAAAVCDGAILALSCLRLAKLEKGQRILVYRASGSVGTAGVQLAKHLGAEVTAVCNTANVDIVRSLGADHVLDYTREDFTAAGETYDVVFDAVGKTSFGRCRRMLERGGTYVDTDPGFLLQNLVLPLVTWRIGSKRVKLLIARYTQADVLAVKEVIEAGAYRPVVDRRYPLDQVIEATRYVETGQKVGNVVLTVT